MMLPGIMLHAFLTCGAAGFGAARNLKNHSSTYIDFDFLGKWLHNFNIPVFFGAAGFLGASFFLMKNLLLRSATFSTGLNPRFSIHSINK
jgi:hypothetical protein